jgi:hypothetical protein
MRNYLIYDEINISSGSNRFLLIAQSDEFIQSFPSTSIDSIERKYLRGFQKNHKYLSMLDERSLDKEFGKLALEKLKKEPKTFFKSILVKAKVFLPVQYYPNGEHSWIKNAAYTIPYLLTLIFFIWSIFNSKNSPFEAKIILILIISYVSMGFVFFLLSRHFYPLISLMLIYSFIVAERKGAIN